MDINSNNWKQHVRTPAAEWPDHCVCTERKYQRIGIRGYARAEVWKANISTMGAPPVCVTASCGNQLCINPKHLIPFEACNAHQRCDDGIIRRVKELAADYHNGDPRSHGYSLRTIGELSGCSATTVRKIIKGLPPFDKA